MKRRQIKKNSYNPEYYYKMLGLKKPSRLSLRRGERWAAEIREMQRGDRITLLHNQVYGSGSIDNT